jgi:hypothetical protein
MKKTAYPNSARAGNNEIESQGHNTSSNVTPKDLHEEMKNKGGKNCGRCKKLLLFSAR